MLTAAFRRPRIPRAAAESPYPDGVNKDVKAFCRELEHAGLTVERSGGGHYRVTAPDGSIVGFVPFSPSTNRWRQNMLTQLRRRGIELGAR
jgi:hypothetical protein